MKMNQYILQSFTLYVDFLIINQTNLIYAKNDKSILNTPYKQRYSDFVGEAFP